MALGQTDLVAAPMIQLQPTGPQVVTVKVANKIQIVNSIQFVIEKLVGGVSPSKAMRILTTSLAKQIC